MKKWIISFAISVLISCLGLVYFVNFIAYDACLGSGARWLGLIQGCEGGNGYTMQYITSPLAILIFLGIILGVSSALVQIYTLFSKFFDAKK